MHSFFESLRLPHAPGRAGTETAHESKLVTLQKEAKNLVDYDLLIQEYRQALLLAPWWSDTYFDLASALELKQQYVEAIENLKLRILANPEGPDARAAQDKIYALEAKSYLISRIADDGPGFLSELLVAQFGAPRASRQGNGPGLYFANCVAQAHQHEGRSGKVVLANSTQEDTVFSLYRP